MTVLQRDGVKLAYVDEGKGEPAFVFMHGWTCNRSYFKPQHDHFKAKHRVVSVDLRGHGESDKPKGPYPIRQYADDVAWLIGVPWHDCMAIGNLLGTRMALNEVIAYISLGAQRATLMPRSFTIATFALCGFANLGSIGMQIGGIGGLAPNRRHDLARLGLRAMFAGTLANFMTATIAGFLI